ncbi:MAG: glycosyltransferase family 2 protein [Thermodesulfobacteriota bacterium]
MLNGYIKKYPSIDYFHSSRIRIDENGCHISGIVRAIESFDLSDFKNYAPLKHLHCWKVESALAIGGMDESLGLHGADDYDFSWCMAEAGYSFKAIPECLYYYRDHREHYRLTTHVPLDIQIGELKKIWNKHGLIEKEIEEQIKIRTSSYLKQALYLDEEDKKGKESENYDIRKGWRIKL